MGGMKLRMPMPPITLIAYENGVGVMVNCKDGVQRVFTDIGYGSLGGDDGHETLVSWLSKYYADNEDKDAQS